MKFQDGHAIMDDGTSYYAFADRLGIGDDMSVTYGYDGGFGEFDYDAGKAVFPPAHRKEIAAYMIALWQKWADSPSEGPRE